MKKPQIPAVPPVEPNLAAVLRTMKQNIEIMNGSREGRIAALPTSATNADIIAKVNEIIDRLNA